MANRAFRSMDPYRRFPLFWIVSIVTVRPWRVECVHDLITTRKDDKPIKDGESLRINGLASIERKGMIVTATLPLGVELDVRQYATYQAPFVDDLAHRNRSDFCDLRLRCPSRTPEIARFPRQEKVMLHCVAIQAPIYRSLEAPPCVFHRKMCKKLFWGIFVKMSKNTIHPNASVKKKTTPQSHSPGTSDQHSLVLACRMSQTWLAEDESSHAEYVARSRRHQEQPTLHAVWLLPGEHKMVGDVPSLWTNPLSLNIAASVCVVTSS